MTDWEKLKSYYERAWTTGRAETVILQAAERQYGSWQKLKASGNWQKAGNYLVLNLNSKDDKYSLTWYAHEKEPQKNYLILFNKEARVVFRLPKNPV